MNRTTVMVGAGFLWLSLACGPSIASTDLHKPEPRLLGKALTVAEVDSSAADAVLPEPLTGNLTLRQVLAQSMLYNPELASQSWSVRAKAAAALQAGLLPNPELEISMENFAGNGEYASRDNAETTIGISQLLELGGKRSKRQAVASLEADLAGWDFEAKRLDVLTSTTKVFFAVLAAQEQLSQAESLAKLAEDFSRTVGARVEAGKVSPVEASRAQVELLTAQVAKKRARLALENARKELAAQWGEKTAAFSVVVAEQEQVTDLPSLDSLLPLLDQNPELARLKAEEDKSSAELALEQAKAFPDLTIGAGVRIFESTNNEAMVASIALPLPLFDRNPGGIAQASAGLHQVRFQRRAMDNQVRTALARSYNALVLAQEELQTFQGKILPAAEQAVEAAALGYSAGKFGFIETLDAQRSLFAVKAQYVDALAAYHQAHAEVERLIGRSLGDVSLETQSSKP